MFLPARLKDHISVTWPCTTPLPLPPLPFPTPSHLPLAGLLWKKFKTVRVILCDGWQLSRHNITRRAWRSMGLLWSARGRERQQRGTQYKSGLKYVFCESPLQHIKRRAVCRLRASARKTRCLVLLTVQELCSGANAAPLLSHLSGVFKLNCI